MKSTGILRKVDQLGRIVTPIELSEYCGMKKPLVRSFEPRGAENQASECIEESQRIKFNRWLSLFI